MSGATRTCPKGCVEWWWSGSRPVFAEAALRFPGPDGQLEDSYPKRATTKAVANSNRKAADSPRVNRSRWIRSRNEALSVWGRTSNPVSPRSNRYIAPPDSNRP